MKYYSRVLRQLFSIIVIVIFSFVMTIILIITIVGIRCRRSSSGEITILQYDLCFSHAQLMSGNSITNISRETMSPSSSSLLCLNCDVGLLVLLSMSLLRLV